MRAMKKMLISAAACGVLAAVVSASALCAQIDVTGGATYTKDSDGNYTVSVDASKMLTQNSGQMTVLVTKAGALEQEGGLKDSDILYIDQVAGATGIFQNMGVKGTLEAGKTYDVFVGGENVKDTNSKAGFYRTSFTVASADTHVVELGKVNDDDYITGSDAVLVLKAAVGNETLTGDKWIAANCNLDEYITGADAVLILKAAVGNATLGKVNVDATGKVVGEAFFD